MSESVDVVKVWAGCCPLDGDIETWAGTTEANCAVYGQTSDGPVLLVEQTVQRDQFKDDAGELLADRDFMLAAVGLAEGMRKQLESQYHH